MELPGISATGKRVPDDDDLELAPLEDVGGVDDHAIDGQSSLDTGVLKCGAEVVSLVAMGNADGDITGPQTPASVLVFDRDVSFEELLDDFNDRVDSVRIGLRHEQVVEFDVGPPVACSAVDCVCCTSAMQRGDTAS
jgi:hypothetical protein